MPVSNERHDRRAVIKSVSSKVRLVLLVSLLSLLAFYFFVLDNWILVFTCFLFTVVALGIPFYVSMALKDGYWPAGRFRGIYRSEEPIQFWLTIGLSIVGAVGFAAFSVYVFVSSL